MECEVTRKGEGRSDNSESLIALLEEQVKAATDELLLTNFTACLELCQHVTTAATACEDTDADTADRLNKVREAATVIGIQALAEQGAWRDVIPFVEQVYTHAAACPANIMQMCLLLHAQVREYMVCHTLFNAWMEWDDNGHHADCSSIVKIYVAHVLVPLGAFNLIPQVVERCPSLTSEERHRLLSPQRAPPPPPPLPPQIEESETVPNQEDTADTHNLLSPQDPHGGEEEKDPPPSLQRIIRLYVNFVRSLFRSFARKGWCRQIRRASKVFFLISFIILALIHVQTDLTTNFSRAMEVWKTAVRSLSSMWQRQSLK